LYEWVDSFDKFNKVKLPPITAFASSFKNRESISKEDYKHAKLVYKKLGCKNMNEYHDLYLKTDALLLTDVYGQYRKTAMKYYRLDPCNLYIMASSLLWDALLKKNWAGVGAVD